MCNQWVGGRACCQGLGIGHDKHRIPCKPLFRFEHQGELQLYGGLRQRSGVVADPKVRHRHASGMALGDEGDFGHHKGQAVGREVRGENAADPGFMLSPSQCVQQGVVSHDDPVIRCGLGFQMVVQDIQRCIWIAGGYEVVVNEARAGRVT